jgi:phospholipid/cholesterol/gamma-HCH transport system ATP-binding protein
MSDPVIEISKLSIGYKQSTVLENINFTVTQGEIVTLLGGSGCGKTSLLMNLIGLRTPFSGHISIKGVDISKGDARSQRWLRQNTGVMFQSGALLSALSLIENVMLPLQEHTNLPQSIIYACALAKLRMVNLGEHAHFSPSDLSGGMVKRAAIARAMALDPSILFLDEPSAGLDPISRIQLDEHIHRLSKQFGITFIIITHELDTITSIADRGIVLNNKHIIADDSIENIRNKVDDPFIKAFFGSETRTNTV